MWVLASLVEIEVDLTSHRPKKGLGKFLIIFRTKLQKFWHSNLSSRARIGPNWNLEFSSVFGENPATSDGDEWRSSVNLNSRNWDSVIYYQSRYIPLTHLKPHHTDNGKCEVYSSNYGSEYDVDGPRRRVTVHDTIAAARAGPVT